MIEFWDFIKVLVIINGSLIALFLILMSIPQSGLSKLFFKIFGIINYIIAGILILYVISPVDLIPDFIPALGQSDDLAGLLGVVIDGIIGYISLKKSALVKTNHNTLSEEKHYDDRNN